MMAARLMTPAILYTQIHTQSWAHRRVRYCHAKTTARPWQDVDYSHLEPLPDPPRRPDLQRTEMTDAFRGLLGPHFADREDVLISGGGYLRREASDDSEQHAPDCVVAFGVDPAAIVARNGYVIGGVGRPPDLVLEVGSRGKGRHDYTVKRDAYLGYGVPEYWRFDHTGGRYHVSALAGDVLVDGEYQAVEIFHEPDGLIWGHSAVLGLDLRWDEGELRFRDRASGEFLLTPEEERAGRLEAERRAEAETARADRAEAEVRRIRERLEELEQVAGVVVAEIPDRGVSAGNCDRTV